MYPGYLLLNSCWIAMCGFLAAFSVSWLPEGIVQEASAICRSGDNLCVHHEFLDAALKL